MATTPWNGAFGVKEGEHFPASNVTWGEAMRFCKLLTADERRLGHQPVALEYRLPTEAEWEYACRAETTTAYSFGDTKSALSEYAWYATNSGSMTHPVGEKHPNAFNLYDMHGNVWEWCSDWYGAYPSGPVTEPSSPSAGLSRVLRGGSWYDSPEVVRSATRSHSEIDHRFNRGFRVACSSIR